MVRRGEVWLTKLDPTIGHEIRKTRPCLIVSPDELNLGLRTFVGLPLTSGSRAAPFRVPTKFRGRNGFILADQIRTFDEARLISRWGQVDAATLRSVLAVLRSMFEDAN